MSPVLLISIKSRIEDTVNGQLKGLKEDCLYKKMTA